MEFEARQQIFANDSSVDAEKTYCSKD